VIGEPTLSCEQVDDLAGLYVLDALDPADARVVARHLEGCDSDHTAFAEVAASAGALALAAEVQDAPADLRDRVMSAVASTPQARPVADPSVPEGQPAQPDHRAGGSSLIDRLRARAGSPTGAPRRAPRWALVAVPALALVLVAIGAFGIWQGQATQTDRLALLREAVVAAADPEATVAVLTGSDAAAGAAGYAVFPADRDGFIVVDGLPGLTGDQVYQAWYVGPGEPLSAGLVDLGGDGLGVLTGLRMMPGTNVVALTVETRPGAPAPTTTPLVVGEIRDVATGQGPGSA
jgi:hypothetical protein